MSHRRAALYLQIPAAYCRSFGGLRWAQYGEAVEFLDGPDAGRTFAFAAEIGQFLEGLLAPGGACPAFGTALHSLLMLGLGDRASTTGPSASFRKERLVRPFRELGAPLRNAGVLFASLGRDVPGVADPPDLADVLRLLNGGSWIPQMVLNHPMLGAMDYAEQPAADPSEFDARVGRRLEDLSDEAIRHWLKFGRSSLAGAEAVQVALPPRGLGGALEQIEERPRLAGLNRLISRLEGALSLPPRRLEHDGPHADGYWDLTTRGSPEQILPIQFALEDEEFLRRFAERELLYFHRETPSRTGGPATRAAAGSRGAHLGRRPARAGRRGDGPGATGRAPQAGRQVGGDRHRRRAGQPGGAGPGIPRRTAGRERPDAEPRPGAEPGAPRRFTGLTRRRDLDPPAQSRRAHVRGRRQPARRRRDPALRRLGRPPGRTRAGRAEARAAPEPQPLPGGSRRRDRHGARGSQAGVERAPGGVAGRHRAHPVPVPLRSARLGPKEQRDRLPSHRLRRGRWANPGDPASRAALHLPGRRHRRRDAAPSDRRRRCDEAHLGRVRRRGRIRPGWRPAASTGPRALRLPDAHLPRPPGPMARRCRWPIVLALLRRSA